MPKHQQVKRKIQFSAEIIIPYNMCVPIKEEKMAAFQVSP